MDHRRIIMARCAGFMLLLIRWPLALRDDRSYGFDFLLLRRLLRLLSRQLAIRGLSFAGVRRRLRGFLLLEQAAAGTRACTVGL